MGARFLAKLGMACVITAIVVPACSAVPVTFRVVDQFGQEIPGANIAHRIYNAYYGTGGTWDIAPGPFPGSVGAAHELRRDFDVVITESTTEIVQTWIMRDVTVHLVNQHGEPLVGARFEFGGLHSDGAQFRLPITDESVYPGIYGQNADGYSMRLMPKVLDTAPTAPGWSPPLRRYVDRDATEVLQSTSEIFLEFATADVLLDTVDQDGAPLPDLRYYFQNVLTEDRCVYTSPPGGGPLTLVGCGEGEGIAQGGSVVRLPVTQHPGYILDSTSLTRTGYEVFSQPSVMGHTLSDTWGFFRIDRFHVTASMTSIGLTWPVIRGPLRVVDQDEHEVPGAVFRFSPWNMPFAATGDWAEIPANSYDVTRRNDTYAVGLNFPGSGVINSSALDVRITVHPDRSITPPFFTAPNGRVLGLRFDALVLDADGDGIEDDHDACPDVPDPVQADLDGDGEGDACDADDDGDGVPDAVDACPLVPDALQENHDGDTAGDACDPDDDDDGIGDAHDDCPLQSNASQADGDLDGAGDACDVDDDGDGVADESDACPGTPDPSQADADGDGVGDACDDDPDGDGVGAGDNCPEVSNAEQTDTDGDSRGDDCDADDDDDGTCDDGLPNGIEGCTAGPDNCPTVAASQADLDGDDIGDACDADLDGDGIGNAEDNCATAPNPSNDDVDGDGEGDACDGDDDDDGILDPSDNCPLVPNAAQDDLESDGVGDACDGDLDGDTRSNDADNCPSTANADQADFDADGTGDACDEDADGDGVSGSADACPRTPLEEDVLGLVGCSIAQLCPCEGPRGSTVSWRSHGEHVSCRARAASAFVAEGILTASERSDVVSEAAQSDCGR